MKNILALCFLSITYISTAQISDSLLNDFQSKLNEDFLLVKTEKGFGLLHVDHYKMNKIAAERLMPYENYFANGILGERLDSMFMLFADSVKYYYSSIIGVGAYPDCVKRTKRGRKTHENDLSYEERKACFDKKYPDNDVLFLEVVFESDWSEDQSKEVFQSNLKLRSKLKDTLEVGLNDISRGRYMYRHEKVYFKIFENMHYLMPQDFIYQKYCDTWNHPYIPIPYYSNRLNQWFYLDEHHPRLGVSITVNNELSKQYILLKNLLLEYLRTSEEPTKN